MTLIETSKLGNGSLSENQRRIDQIRSLAELVMKPTLPEGNQPKITVEPGNYGRFSLKELNEA